MDFEDRLRARFRSADASIASERLDRDAVMDRARSRRVVRFALAAAALAVVVVGAFFVTDAARRDEGLPPIAPGPTGTETPSPSFVPPGTPTPEATPVEPTELRVTPQPIPGVTCSATGMSYTPADMDALPDAVAEKREAILDAAIRCDYDALAELAGQSFSYSVVQSGDPAGYWRELEESGNERVMEALVNILELEPTEQAGYTHVFIWPAVAGPEPSDADWEAVKPLYDPEVYREMRRNDNYIGYRTVIGIRGQWLLYVAGD